MQIEWNEAGEARSARWRSEGGAPLPRRVQIAEDTLTADAAFSLASEGTAMLWRGDFQNARQLVQAIARRMERPPRNASKKARDKAIRTTRNAADAAETATSTVPTQTFHLYRQAQAQRARVLGMVLISIDGDYGIALRRAPDLKQAATEAWGAADGEASVVSLRELLGLVGAHEWRKKGVEIPALGQTKAAQVSAPYNRIHPHYGVFSPVRGEYVDLIAKAPWPAAGNPPPLAFDIGTGTGVLAAVLARRGVARIIATDEDARALACAAENIERLGIGAQVELLVADLFPPGRAPLIVCNPPWLPARASSPIEHAIYDENSRMLRGFLAGLRSHLTDDGEGWLVLSDLAEHLGLRRRAELLEWISAAGLSVVNRFDIKPRHGKAADAEDPLHAARAAEVTSLWRLR